MAGQISCTTKEKENMKEPIVAPYGSWKSPITSDLIVEKSIGLKELQVDGDDLYWIESRPNEKGRNVIVRRRHSGEIEEINPSPLNARSRVHEYGGGAFLVHEGTVYFSNFADQRLYRRDPGREPRAITPETNWRYTDGDFDEKRNRIYYVREDHTDPEREAINTIVSVDPDGQSDQVVLISGSDFYSNPRISDDASMLCWLSWNHPNMPWDGTELWMAPLTAEGNIGKAEKVAGGIDESIYQPEWSPDGSLYFISDKTGWWNFYRYRKGEAERSLQRSAEFGAPAWNFGSSTYTIESAERIICSYSTGGIGHLAALDTRTFKLTSIETPYSSFGSKQASSGKLFFLGTSPTEPTSVVQLDLNSGEAAVLKRSSNLEIDTAYVSIPEAIEFPTENGLTAHAFYYPPTNRDFTSIEGKLPPLLVFIHGGPTGSTSNNFNISKQFWTSRGFAIVDVNYGGSTGYGRAYRRRLNGNWGIIDVDDSVNATKYLVKRGDADPDRLAIRGGSAGGFTTLACLTFRDTFKAGASYFGVSDLGALARDTHKFESRYLDSMIGPYPEKDYIYQERSPINSVDNLSSPLIFFQGLDDKVVPPNQAEMMFDILLKKGLPVAHITYEGEGHGFRQAKNIKHSLESELYFYSRVFGFDPADELEPIEIKNLK
jgi:dipeptidyl aminopeptidase/acylaminoacyl peptidase